MSARLGVLGGMFDPVHNGHIAAARCAVRELGLASLHLVPCHIPNHRAAASAAAVDRLAMLELAVADETDLVVNPIEINRDQVSYSVETLASLRSASSCEQLVFVLGLDAFAGITRWHEWQRLFELCHFFVLARTGATLSPAVGKTIELASRQVGSAAELFSAKAGRVWIQNQFRMDLSSSQVRAALAQQHDKQQPLHGLLNPQVLDYIVKHKLYGITG